MVTPYPTACPYARGSGGPARPGGLVGPGPGRRPGRDRGPGAV